MDLFDEDNPQGRPARGPRRAARIDDDTAQDIQYRMAAMTTRRRCNEHDCQAPVTGECDHPAHRQKVDFTLTMLDMLGLDHSYPAYTEKEKAAWLKWIGQAGPPDDLSDLAA